MTSMKVSVTYEDTDVAKALESIIKHPNGAEFVKLLSPMICTSNTGVEYFFKLLIGNTLPTVISSNTLCYISIERIGYGCNKNNIRDAGLTDDQDRMICTVKSFRGYHEYSQYEIEYTNVLDNGTKKKETGWVRAEDLTEIEEF
jgi:hypothetical protein